MQDLRPFFAAQHFVETQDVTYNPLQWGAHIQAQTSDYFDLDVADVVIVGCGKCAVRTARLVTPTDRIKSAKSFIAFTIGTPLYELLMPAISCRAKVPTTRVQPAHGTS
jgi:hypothetical protein